MKIHLAVALVLMATAAAKLHEMLGDSSDLLRSGRYAEALKIDDVVIHEMGEHYVSGPATTQMFCIAVVHKALALAGLGRDDDALWYWNAAVSLYPPIAHSDTSAYGAGGKFLAEHPPGLMKVRVARDAQIVPPSVLKRVDAEYPSRSLTSEVEGEATFEFVVGRDGRAHTPRVVNDMGAPLLAFATLEAIRQWQFAPATADGQPIDAPYRLTMKYKVLR